MTATTLGAPGAVGAGRSRSRLWLWVAVGIGLVVVALVAGGPKAKQPALSPDSTAADGTKALTVLLGESGAQVEVVDQVPDASTDVALLLSDTTSPAMTDDLQRWVEAGGTLVVADPASSFVPIAASSIQLFGRIDPRLEPGACDIDALSLVGDLAPAGAGVRYGVPDGSGRCFTDDRDDAYVVDTPTGAGHIVAVGGTSTFVNASLDQEDNAVLAVDLLAPRDGTRVAVLWGMTSDSRSSSLSGLVSTGVRLAFLQLGIAFVVYAWWRGRRLGRPVLEPQLVQIGGSELVAAVGNLLQQTKDPDRAARLLRADLRRQLCDRLGLARGATADVIADVTADRTGVDRDRVARAVSDIPIRTEDELLDLARDIDRIRTEVLHGTAP